MLNISPVLHQSKPVNDKLGKKYAKFEAAHHGAFAELGVGNRVLVGAVKFGNVVEQFNLVIDRL